VALEGYFIKMEYGRGKLGLDNGNILGYLSFKITMLVLFT